jgi:hypothetical protein
VNQINRKFEQMPSTSVLKSEDQLNMRQYHGLEGPWTNKRTDQKPFYTPPLGPGMPKKEDCLQLLLPFPICVVNELQSQRH